MYPLIQKRKKMQQLEPKKYKTVFVSRENEVNKILREQRKTKSNVRILFTSIWDQDNDICLDLRDKVLEREDPTDLYVVDSFSVPHSFVIFKIAKTPALVSLRKEKVVVEDYVPKIYSELGV